mgnify:CR=1 FL=1
MIDIFFCFGIREVPIENFDRICPLCMTEYDMIQMDKNMRHFIEKYCPEILEEEGS